MFVGRGIRSPTALEGALKPGVDSRFVSGSGVHVIRPPEHCGQLRRCCTDVDKSRVLAKS